METTTAAEQGIGLGAIDMKDKIYNYLFVELRQMYDRPKQSFSADDKVAHLGMTVIGMPNEKNFRDFASELMKAYKEGIIDAKDHYLPFTVVEIERAENRKRFIFVTSVSTKLDTEELLAKSNFANAEGIVPQLVHTNPYSPEEEVIEESNNAEAIEKNLLEYLADEKVQANGRIVAQDIEKTFRANWFTLDQLIKKTSFKTHHAAFNILNTLCLLGFCFKKNFNKEVKYKVTLDPKDRIALIEEEIEGLKDRIVALEVQKEKLIGQSDS